MQGVARERARQLGIENVEFRQLELEWIDLETASVDAVLCRWGVMLCVDPGAALREIRRVVRPGGRVALAVWDEPEANPWATIPARTLIDLGHSAPPAPGEPGPFALSAPGELKEMMADAGFVDVVIDYVEVGRPHPSAQAFVEEILDLSQSFAQVWERLPETERAEVSAEIARRLKPYTGDDGGVRVPGRSLVAAASA
jgi:SAM-dependent methyltransferase